MRIICLSGWLAVAINPYQWSSTVHAGLHHICLQWSYNGVGLSMCNLFLLQAVSLKINSALFCSGNKGRISRKVIFFFFGLFCDGDSTDRIIKMTHTIASCFVSHISVMLRVSHIHLHRLLLFVQPCCHLLGGKVTNKIQESFSSREYYQADGMKF